MLQLTALSFIVLDAAMTVTIDNTNVTPEVLFALQSAFHWCLLLIGISATDAKHINKFFRFAGVWVVRTVLLLAVRFPRVMSFASLADFYDDDFLHVLLGVFQVFSLFFYVALIRAIN
jgi:hypothetical protein